MLIKKKFLLCSILVGLSPIVATQAGATSIVNLDDMPHNVDLMVAGKEMHISLMPYQRWQSDFYPIRVIYPDYQSPPLKIKSEYAIWPGGDIALQLDRHHVYRRY